MDFPPGQGHGLLCTVLVRLSRKFNPVGNTRFLVDFREIFVLRRFRVPLSRDFGAMVLEKCTTLVVA